MTAASASTTLALPLFTLTLLWSPVAAQDGCPRASGPDAEAGWAAYSSNDIEGARQRFEAALARCPGDPYARTGLGYVELRQGDTQSALSTFAAVVASEPNNVDALTGLGLASWRVGDLESVEAYLTRVTQLVPDHPTAAEYLRRVSEAGQPPSADPANDAWLRGDTAGALELYLARLADDPDDAVAALRVGLVFAWQGDYSRSLELLDGLIDRQPGNLEARLARARVRAWSGDLGQAQEDALEVLAVEPGHAEALEALALFQSWAGEVDEALASYDELLEISPRNGAVGRHRAQTLAWSSRFEASRAAYDALLERDPDDIQARLGLARTLAYSQDFTASITEYDRVLGRAPDHLQALVGKARTLGWAGLLTEGERVAEEAVGADPSSAEAWAVLGQLYRWQGRAAAAKEALETSASLAPTNAEVLDQLRSVDLALAPVARPIAVYERDSDENRMITTRLSGRWYPAPRLEVTADGYYKDLRQRTLLRTAAGGIVRGSYQLEPGWKVSAGVGGSRTDGSGSPSVVELHAGLSSPERYPVVASLTYRSVGLNETAVLADLGARADELLLAGRWTPAARWRVDGSVGYGRYVGIESNGRRSASLSTSRLVGRFFSFGASLRGFSFEENLDEGYFDPDFYGIAELTAYWLYRPGDWTLLVEAAPGIQKVRSDGDSGTSIRSNARLAYAFGPGREVSLALGFSSAGLVSFASTATDYRYTTVVLGTSWAF